ncbi:MAG: cobyric acid synthase [Chloroflexi bacterium]|nr:cobyric acid synthase [Chloroflexota bacterium]
MTAPVLLVVGTASSVGKSVLVTALCRVFARRGLRLAPFKAQNMSNNAAVTADGLEVGRAQAEQAAAAGVEVEVDMNPVLLKPQGDRTSQLILNGRPAGTMSSREFLDRRRDLWPPIEAALGRLRDRYDLVVAEGAGNAAEPNLYATEVVNMRVARHTGAITLLVGDIDRGGVFGHFLGTLGLMPPEDRVLVRGLVINRFRGDPTLLTSAIDVVEARGGVPVLGIVPWIDEVGVSDEDAVVLERAAMDAPRTATGVHVDVAAIRFPRIANFDDLDPLASEPGVRVRWVEDAAQLGLPDLIVLPGTKATIADLRWLRARGLDAAIRGRAEAGAFVLGICGGYQMLGERIVDPAGVEAEPGASEPGLGLLPLVTTFVAAKSTRRVTGQLAADRAPWGTAGLAVAGYEIHMGQTTPSGPTGVAPLIALEGRMDGAVSADGRVAGTYLHGLLHNDGWRTALLQALGRALEGNGGTAHEQREAAFERLADVIEASLDVDLLEEWLFPLGRPIP